MSNGFGRRRFAAGAAGLAGGTMTGPIVLAADPAAALQPATKQYVDAISHVTATGTSTARTLASRFADTLNLLDFILVADTDATAGFGRAVARALAIGHPVEIFIPAGNYSLSSTISITTAAAQGVHVRGAGASTVIITQTADADAFDVSLTNFGGISGTGAFSVSGITLKMGAASTTRTALSVSSTAPSGAQGVPMILDDITLISTSGTSLWGTGISLAPANGPVYLTRINSTYGTQSSAGTAIALSGNGSTYTTNVYLDNCLFIAGNVGLSLGNYLQGIQIHNLNTINTLYSVYSAPTLGGNEEIKISDSYLDGKFYFSASNPNTLDAVKVINTYFDSDTLVASDNHVTFNNVSVLTLVGNTFNGKGGAISGVTGLYINGTSLFETTLLGNTIQSYGVTGGVGIKFSATTSSIMAVGNQFINNVTDISDAGTNNIFSSTNVRGVFYLYGMPGDVPVTPAVVLGPLSTGGVSINTAIQYLDTGGSVTIGAGISQLFFHSGTALASAAITMPAAPTNTASSIQDLVVTTDVAITSVTWVLGAGTQIFLGAALPSTLPAGGEVRFKWYQALNAWVHVVMQ